MKNLLMVMGLFVIMALVAMPIMAQESVVVPTQEIQTGTFNSTGTNLSTGTGERQLTVAVSFPKGFKVKPEVMVSLTMIDAAGGVGTRVNVMAEGVSRDGFIAVVKTWADSKVYGVNGNWIAFAPATATVKIKK
jgi:hypothetical protein